MSDVLFSVSDAAASLRDVGLLDAGPPKAADSLLITNVQIDSRSCSDGSLFVALSGERTDGHRFLNDAASRGAVAALVREDAIQRRRTASGMQLLPVRSPLAALTELAAQWLNRYSMTRVAITGSNGKTTTKELVTAALSQDSPTLASRGNFNSDVGLPLELFRARPEHRYGVFELAMNRAGEIGELAAMVRPDVALVTNIGTAHIGLLGSRDGIAHEKRRVFSAFSGEQVALIPEQDEYAAFLADGVAGRVVLYGPDSTPGFLGSERLQDGGTLLRFEWGAARILFSGDHMVQNALGAVAIGRELGVGPEAILSGLSSVRPAFGRGELIQGPVKIMQDCYNANPESMEASLTSFFRVPHQGRRLVVLGGMRELGAFSADAHQRVAVRAGEAGPDLLWFYGDEWEPAVRNLSGVRRFSTEEWDGLVKDIASNVSSGDFVLLKGSRAYELERLVPVLNGAAGVLHE